MAVGPPNRGGGEGEREGVIYVGRWIVKRGGGCRKGKQKKKGEVNTAPSGRKKKDYSFKLSVQSGRKVFLLCRRGGEKERTNEKRRRERKG